MISIPHILTNLINKLTKMKTLFKIVAKIFLFSPLLIALLLCAVAPVILICGESMPKPNVGMFLMVSYSYVIYVILSRGNGFRFKNFTKKDVSTKSDLLNIILTIYVILYILFTIGITATMFK